MGTVCTKGEVDITPKSKIESKEMIDLGCLFSTKVEKEEAARKWVKNKNEEEK